MWEFDEAVEVHSVVADGIETPDQFLWRGRLWRVCSVQSHWTETAAWWERGIIGTGLTYDGRADHWTHAERAYTGGAASGADRVHAGASVSADIDRAHAGASAPGAHSGSTLEADTCLATRAPSGAHAGSAAMRHHPNGPAASASPRSLADCLAALAPGGSGGAFASAGSATGADPAGGEPGRGTSGSPAAVGVLDADWGPRRTVYRVEAGCGRHGRRELFDLAHDPDSGRWQLERVTDR